ncbi:RHS repeat-associated core domain-containing protein [Desnuesiella massiliensis]|uniref:RHS repeat-associated core domain-containing protein n=1 Tax=Desnuesiella massiliensis TaxID=1650662 RepID=UPI003BFA745F
MNLNGAEYFYLRNAQGDIIGLIDGDGVRVVSYAYDSWGKLISIKDKDSKDVTTDTNHVGYKNPYRYRGYRYDNETGLYYLQSRYYNPEWGRFLNADGIGGEVGILLSHNMFTYCFNNPVNLEDPSGNWPTLGQIFKAAAIVAVTAVVVTSVILAAPAVAGAAAIAAGMTLGAGTIAATSTIVSVAAIGVGVGIGVFGVNRAVEAVTGTNYVAKTVFRGNKTAYNVTEAAFNIAGTGMLSVAANNTYTRTEAPAIFKGNGGWGFKPSKNIQALYSNPNADGGPGGTFVAYNNKLSGTKWRIDWDPAHGMHGHWGAGKAAFTAHRGIWPWNFGQSLDE